MALYLYLFLICLILSVAYLWLTCLEARPTQIYARSSTVGLGEPKISLLELIQQRVPSLFKPFQPAWWLPGGHFQTCYCALGNFSREHRIQYERKFFRSLDGGLFTADITPSFSTRPYVVGEPVLIVLHGLTGGSHESYVRAVLSVTASSQNNNGLGMRGIVLNFRGCAESPVLSKKLYHAGSTEDLRSLILWISGTMPSSALYAIGFSLGSNVLINYCGEEGDACPLTAAISMANIWDYYKAGHHIETGSLINRYVYDHVLGDALRKVIKKNMALFADETRFSVTELLERRFIRMRYYCDVVNSHLGGFKDANDYYRRASCVRRIHHVRTPILAINARDDPLACEKNLPFDEIQSTPWIVLATTAGGHMGWFGPGCKRWYVEPVRDFFRAFLEMKMEARPRPVPLSPDAHGMVYQAGRPDIGYAEVKGDTIVPPVDVKIEKK